MAWNQSNGAAAKPQPKKPSALRGVIAGVVCAAIAAAVAIFVLSGKDEKPKAKVGKSPSMIKETKPVAIPKESATEVAEKPEPPKAAKDDMWLGSRVIRRTIETNQLEIVETMYTEDGKKHLYTHDRSKPIFQHSSDQILAMVTGDTSGNAPPLPGLDSNFENEFAESLKTEIVINEDDSEEVKEIKSRVKQARQDLLDAMGAGMSAQDVIMEHRKMMENNAQLRMEAVKGLREYLDKGDKEGAREYVETMNKALEQMGVMKIEIPKSRAEIIAERRARKAAKRNMEESK